MEPSVVHRKVATVLAEVEGILLQYLYCSSRSEEWYVAIAEQVDSVSVLTLDHWAFSFQHWTGG